MLDNSVCFCEQLKGLSKRDLVFDLLSVDLPSFRNMSEEIENKKYVCIYKKFTYKPA